MIHCDLKPENILVELSASKKEFSAVKIIDFGSSCWADDSESIAVTTLEYMPPELVSLFLLQKELGQNRKQLRISQVVCRD